MSRLADLVVARGGNVNRRLALMDIRAEARHWMLVPIVFALAAVLITLPLNLLSTFESPRFITYMGVAESDVRADLQFTEDVDSLRGDVLSAMQNDDRLTNVRAFAKVLYQTEGEEGMETLHVEVGDYSDGTVEYLEGGPPEPGQVALSVLNADEYGVETGDEMTVSREGDSTVVEVSGVYQDVTSSGLTAKMQGEVTSGAAAYVIYADTVDGADPAEIATEYGEDFPAAAVIPTQDYVQQTWSHVTEAFRSATVLSLVFGIGVAVLITSLFLKLRLTSERRKMGGLSALGFSTGELVADQRGAGRDPRPPDAAAG
jgi:putative ABC transport system permease protein